jgi:LysR family transcriptional regulator for metE and metH
MIVEIRHLETLTAISATGSLTHAARRLNLTLSAVSHQLRELETLLGVVLLDRRKKPIELSPEGARLLACAERVLPEVRAAEAALLSAAQGRQARLHLALECHSCFDWLLPTLDRLREAWPDLDLDLRTGPRFAPIPALLGGEVDAVLGTDRVPHRDISYASLFRYEIVLVVAPGHRLAGVGHIEPSELRDEPLVTYPVELERLDIVTRFLRPAGIEPRRGRTAELTNVLLQLVRSRRGVAGLPRWAVADAVLRREVEVRRLGSGLWSELFVATRARDENAPHLVAFRDVARATSRELLPEIEPCPA